MAAFILVEEDPFAMEADAAQTWDTDPGGAWSALRDYSHVRRPLRGMQIKDDTYATIQVFTSDLKNLGLYDSGGNRDSSSGSWSSQPLISNFIIQSVQRVQEEKFHLVETFGEDYGFFFGQKPRMMRFSGVLANSEDFNWRSEWWHNYEQNLRGTKLVERGARVYLTYDSIALEGYLIRSSTTEDSRRPREVPFTFTMWVTRHSDVSNVGSTQYPITGGGIDVYKFDTALESSLMRMRNMNTAAFKARSVIDAVKWGIQNITGPLGMAHTLIEKAKQFAFGGANTVPISALGAHVMVASGTHIAPGSAPAGWQARSAFGQVTVRGPDTSRYGVIPANRVGRSRIWDNIDEYPARDIPNVYPFHPAHDPLLLTKLAASNAEVFGQTFLNFAKFGVNLTASVVSQVQATAEEMSQIVVEGGQNFVRTENEAAEYFGVEHPHVPETAVVESGGVAGHEALATGEGVLGSALSQSGSIPAGG